MSFTGHAVLATRLTASACADLDLDGFGSALSPTVLQRMAGPGGRIGVTDVTLAAYGIGGGRLRERTDLDDHPRVQHAHALRQQVRVHGDERGVVTLARGLVGRDELSVELAPEMQGRGAGRALIRDALTLVPAGQTVFAAVTGKRAVAARIPRCRLSPARQRGDRQRWVSRQQRRLGWRPAVPGAVNQPRPGAPA